MRPIDADALKKSITDYHAGLFPRYISKLVDAEIEDIKDIIDEQITIDYVPRQQWISVKDKVPDEEVLAANFEPGTYGYKEYIIGYVSEVKCTEPDWHNGKCYAENDNEILDNVTHWMPLPEPPKEEE